MKRTGIKFNPECTTELKPELMAKLAPELMAKLAPELAPELKPELKPELMAKPVSSLRSPDERMDGQPGPFRCRA